jgi:hypothetical protein
MTEGSRLKERLNARAFWVLGGGKKRPRIGSTVDGDCGRKQCCGADFAAAGRRRDKDSTLPPANVARARQVVVVKPGNASGAFFDLARRRHCLGRETRLNRGVFDRQDLKTLGWPGRGRK